MNTQPTANLDADTPENLKKNPSRIPGRRSIAVGVFCLLLLAWIASLEVRTQTAASSISRLESYIDNVATVADRADRLARNADNYAHSHGYSDARLKTEVHPYTEGLRDTSRIKVVTYEWRSGEPAGTQVGVLAQQLLQIAPHLVSTDTQGILHVDYAGLTPILLQALQDQQVQIDALEKRIKVIEVP